MAIPIKKFGQYVLLKAFSEDGQLVFETDSLKIDFDVRHIPNYSLAKVTLTNLNPETIKKLSDASNASYVSIWTSLHDSDLEIVIDSMYISNALEEIQVPESIFNMYCYSKLRRLYLEEQVDIQVESPTIEGMVEAAIKDTGFNGDIEFRGFPPEVLSYVPDQTFTRLQGSLLSVLKVLSKQYRFNLYTESGKFVIMYKPDDKNLKLTDFYSNPADVVLSTTNMRSNPKIGPATLSVVSNLDPLIKPSSILDVSELLTIGTDTSEETLQVAQDYLKEKVSGFSKYQTLSVQHKGSNWTGDWITQAAATSPTKGTTMPTNVWWA